MLKLQIFNNFLGKWKIYKTINKKPLFRGFALFEYIYERNTTYKYIEKGISFIDNKAMNAYKDYYYIFTCNDIEVHFNNFEFIGNNNVNSLFHNLVFSSKDDTFPCYAKGFHLCCNDVYYLLYKFINFNKFKIKCTVLGPEKNYTIETFYFKKK